MITIKNLKIHKQKHPYDIKVCRPSALGNPFILKEEKDRDKVCDQYEKYFNDLVNAEENLNNVKNVLFYSELNRLLKIHKEYGKLSLFCWCKPCRCHAETIKKWLEKKL